MDIIKRIFIVGVGRSGTSLLQSMLNAHSQIAFLPETQYLRKYVLNARVFNNQRLFKSRLVRDSSFSRLGIEIGNEVIEPRRLYNELSRNYLELKNKNILGDKDPKNIENIEKLHQAFESPLIVHIIRDPRDVILSRMKADWSKKYPFFLHVLIYEYQIRLGIRSVKRLPLSDIAEIRYEDLLSDHKQVLGVILRKRQLMFETEQTNFIQSSKELVDSSELQWKKETFQELNSHNTGKWIDEFTCFQLTLIEVFCHKSMIRNRYVAVKAREVDKLSSILVDSFLVIFATAYSIFKSIKRL